MTKDFKAGDHVSWHSEGHTVQGTIVKKLTHETDIKGHHVAASADNPQYLVKSTQTGKEAAHHAQALTKSHAGGK